MMLAGIISFLVCMAVGSREVRNVYFPQKRPKQP